MTLNFEWKATRNTIRLELQKNGSTVLATKTLGDTNGFLVTSGFWVVQDLPVALKTNDVLTVYAVVSDSSQDHQYTLKFIQSPGITLDTASSLPVPILVGDTAKVNEGIPKNIKQIDFLTSLVKLFNLYVWEDKLDERLIHIAPYVEFYSPGSQNSVDWTYKLDRSQPVRHTPMSEINAKTFVFKYKDDSDYYNDLYKKRYNLTYGTHSYNTEFEFVQQTETVEIIFAPTPLVGYTGEAKVYSTIFKMNNSVEENMDSVIRILQAKKVLGVPSWSIKSGNTVLTSTTNYGYAGHFDDPDNVTNDLNFGILEELFFVLVSGDMTVNQFNVYWSPYMAEITDKDSQLLTGRFYLTPKDVLDLDFSKYVYVDGTLFRLNKITDYNLTKPDTCEVRLLKVINTTYSGDVTPIVYDPEDPNQPGGVDPTVCPLITGLTATYSAGVLNWSFNYPANTAIVTSYHVWVNQVTGGNTVDNWYTSVNSGQRAGVLPPGDYTIRVQTECLNNEADILSDMVIVNFTA
jgi:hypothetical protein